MPSVPCGAFWMLPGAFCAFWCLLDAAWGLLWPFGAFCGLLMAGWLAGCGRNLVGLAVVTIICRLPLAVFVPVPLLLLVVV